MKLYREPVILTVTLVCCAVFFVVKTINDNESKLATVDHVTPVPLKIGNQPLPKLPKEQSDSKTPKPSEQQQQQDNMLNSMNNAENALNQSGKKVDNKTAAKFAKQYSQLQKGSD